VTNLITLKRNKAGTPVPATGLRIRKSSIYTPGQTEIYRISRSRFNDFLSCARCFYFDRVLGMKYPSLPGWTLNETTDLLLKLEFDECRAKQIPHRIFKKYGLDELVPLKHDDINHWRDALRGGLHYQVPQTNIVLHGGVDDVWYDTKTKQVVIAEYKSQANRESVTTEAYLSNGYHGSYKVQLDVYAYLMTNMGFSVSHIGYFYVCNADRNALSFDGNLKFEESLVPYELDLSWVEPQVLKMTSVLNSNTLPDENPACENCAYSKQRVNIEAN